MSLVLARSVILFGALAFSIAFQEIALRLRAQERSAWWASNGRDVANALALTLLLLAIRWAGAPWHLALFLAGTITLVLTAVARALYEKMRQPWRVVALVGMALVLPLAVDIEKVLQTADELIGWLYSG